MPPISGAARASIERCLRVGRLALDGVLEIRPERAFATSAASSPKCGTSDDWREAGIDLAFRPGQSFLSRRRGVLRGLHFQRPPAAQDKLVRVSRGAIFDVAVDIRRGSPTFGQWVGVTLSGRGVEPVARSRRASRTAS